MSELTERLDALRALIQSHGFLTGDGLSNEVNIRIFCYAAEDEMPGVYPEFCVNVLRECKQQKLV